MTTSTWDIFYSGMRFYCNSPEYFLVALFGGTGTHVKSKNKWTTANESLLRGLVVIVYRSTIFTMETIIHQSLS